MEFVKMRSVMPLKHVAMENFAKTNAARSVKKIPIVALVRSVNRANVWIYVQIKTPVATVKFVPMAAAPVVKMMRNVTRARSV
jgi:hypothetical protein